VYSSQHISQGPPQSAALQFTAFFSALPVKEPAPGLGIRPHADVVLAKNGVTNVANHLVHTVSEALGYNNAAVQGGDWAIKVGQNAQDRGGVCVCL